jgi:UDP:flavonoid glycosyltransferase YjiC (YdhE family)
MRIFVTTAPGYGLMLPLIPIAWAARAAGHEVLLGTTSNLEKVAAEAGLTTVDVAPGVDIWGTWNSLRQGNPVSERFRVLGEDVQHPFGVITLITTEGTIEAARRFQADLIIYPSDHAAGYLTAQALGIPALEVGNRITWSTRDNGEGNDIFRDQRIMDHVRAELSIPAAEPNILAKVDPRAPSMGGLAADEGQWWPMRFVSFNGGAVMPDWALQPAVRPRIGVTLGTVVPQFAGTTSLTVVVDALAEMDVDVILAQGDADISQLTLPENVRAVGFLALSAFLPGSSLLIHHGGSGTTASALHHGIPQVVLPAFADNPASAALVAQRGLGLAHDPKTVDVPTLQDMVKRVLTEPAFAAAAREVAAEMANQPSPADVIRRVEGLLQ